MTSPKPAEAWDVTLHRPGYEDVTLGPTPYRHTAAEWSWELQSQMTGTQHVEGTTVEVTEHTAACTHPGIDDTAPGDVAAIAARLRAEKDTPRDGTEFPDLCSRLLMRFGHDRGGTLFSAACGEIDREAETDEAIRLLDKAVREALSAASTAAANLNRLRTTLYDVDYAEDSDGADLDAALSAAAAALRAARRITRRHADILDAAPAVNLTEFAARASGDPAKQNLELVHNPCGARLCDIEAGDELEVLADVAQSHVCAAGQQ